MRWLRLKALESLQKQAIFLQIKGRSLFFGEFSVSPFYIKILPLMALTLLFPYFFIEKKKNQPKSVDILPEVTSFQSINIQAIDLAATAKEAASVDQQAIHPGENPEVRSFINQMRVTGVRNAGKKSKILFDNHVASVDDVIDEEHQLRVKNVNSRQIVFLDGSGIEYTKSLLRTYKMNRQILQQSFLRTKYLL